ncbi:unnamed protein product, partial [Rhizoctonia solani]
QPSGTPCHISLQSSHEKLWIIPPVRPCIRPANSVINIGITPSSTMSYWEQTRIALEAEYILMGLAQTNITKMLRNAFPANIYPGYNPCLTYDPTFWRRRCRLVPFTSSDPI